MCLVPWPTKKRTVCTINGKIVLLNAATLTWLKEKYPRYFIRTPYNGVLASQTRHDYCPQSS
ncbi:hypothetical protein C9226_23245, partial [Escherichia coli]